MDRLFIDTEFTSLSDDAKLISIGLVDESGKHKFYAELADTWQPSDAGGFAQREIMPHLEGGASRIPLVTLKQYLAAWIIARTEGEEAARSALHYVAPVGEKEEYVSRAMKNIAPYLP